MNFLPHIAARVLGVPLMMARQKLDVILAVLGSRVGIPSQAPESFVPPVRTVPPAPQGVAIIPVHGSLVARTSGLDAESGLTSYAQISEAVAKAEANPAVGKILLHIDSPGGEVNGAFDLADQIKSSAKPVWAIIDGMGFSAAYLLASATSKIILTRTSGVGSIGVIAMHVDQSQRDERDGMRYTALFAGERKNDLSPHAPLADAAAQELQAEVDRLYTMFVDAVAGNRGISPDAVRATQARLFWGRNGITNKLADDVGILSTTLEAMQMPNPRTKVSMAEESDDSIQVTCPNCGHEFVVELAPTEQVDPEQVDPVNAAVEIAQMCQLAGFSDKTAGYLGSGKTPRQVRQELLRLKAQSQSQGIRSAFTGNNKPMENPLLAAAKRLANRKQ